MLLEDRNEDGSVIVLAFGDSITDGFGDGTQPGDFVERAPAVSNVGYPSRLENLLGLNVDSEGVPGETASDQGEFRFPFALQSSNADVAVIMEGTNDAIFETSQIDYTTAIQSMINYAKALGSEVLLVTIIPPCCDRSGREIFTSAYNAKLKELAIINNVKILDLATIWTNSSNSPTSSEFYNRPEGLHPNSKGYDLVAHAIASGLLDIDVLSGSGPRDLESSLGLDEGSVFIRTLGEETNE